MNGDVRVARGIRGREGNIEQWKFPLGFAKNANTCRQLTQSGPQTVQYGGKQARGVNLMEEEQMSIDQQPHRTVCVVSALIKGDKYSLPAAGQMCIRGASRCSLSWR